MVAAGVGEWVLLQYRLPRDPSTPRIAVWRTLRRLGVAQVLDGLVALPADARTLESLQWVAGDVRAAGGSAELWLARPATRAQEQELAAAMAAARAEEYRALGEEAAKAAALSGPERQRAVRRVREELRRIRRRDFFPPPERDAVVVAVRELSGAAGMVEERS